MTYKSCFNCTCTDIEDINTLKHRWYTCNECNASIAIKKRKYLFSYALIKLPLKLLNLIFFNKLTFLESDYLPTSNIEKKKARFYRGYEKYLTTENGLDPWKGCAKVIMDRLKENKVSYKNKKILALSGGPGLIPKDFSKYADVTVTEYDPVVVKAIETNLGLETHLYDMNKDTLENAIQKKTFDIILAESVVNFCGDQVKFVRDLEKVLNENAVVIISNDLASLGYQMTWQFADYIPTHFLHPDSFKSLFLSSKHFTLIAEYQNKYNAYWFRLGQGGWKNKIVYFFRTIFWFLFGLKIVLSNKNTNRKWWSCNKIYYFRYNKSGN